MAAVAREPQEEHIRNSQSRNTSVPRINEENNTQFYEEVEGRVATKLSQEFSRAASRILGALSKLDEFLLNPQVRTPSGTVPETFRNTNVENQEPNEDRSQDDPYPEVGPSGCQSLHSIDSDPDEAPDRNIIDEPNENGVRTKNVATNKNVAAVNGGSEVLSHSNFPLDRLTSIQKKLMLTLIKNSNLS